MSDGSLRLFAPCPRGLEAVLQEELRELGVQHCADAPGGVHFRGSWRDVYRVNLRSRIASRVLVQIAKAAYRTEDDVNKLAHSQAWEAWFTAEQTLRVDVTATKCPLRSVEFVTLRIKDGVCDRFREASGIRPSIDTRQPDVRVYGFLDERSCTLYLDTSGDALFKRGWRLETGDAPLRENLAAGILRLAGWRPGIALLDPMCGSGTFAVEAAQIALGIASGGNRTFGFERLKNFDAVLWDSVRAEVVDSNPEALAMISASDVSGDAVVATRANLIRAGIADEYAGSIAPKQIDARHVRAQASSGVMVVNPPYGERIGVRGDEEASEFFAQFGNTLKQRFAGWQCYVLTSDMVFQKKLRLAPSRRTPLFNGAIECRLFRFELVTGSNRGPTDAPAPPVPEAS